MEPDQLAEKYGDRRPLAEMQFAADLAGDPDQRAAAAQRVRALLEGAGVHVADDIDKLGCTGLIAHGLTLEEASFVRFHWAGAAHVLPCYVGPHRYCLVHSTIGGLQENQEGLHPETVAVVSRELTAEERDRVGLIDRARRARTSDEARDMLRGQAGGPSAGPEVVELPDPVDFEHDWVCPEHDEMVWSCRFCIASEVVQSELEPQFVIAPAFGGDTECANSEVEPVKPADIPKVIQDHDDRGASALAIFVKAVRYERRFVKT